MAISQTPALTAHKSSSLLWEINIWQTRSWQIYPTLQMEVSQNPALLWEFIFDRPRVLADLSPCPKWQFHRFLLWLLIFFPTLRGPYLADKCLDRSTHHLKWQFHTFLLWLLIFISYSKSSTFGRPGLGRSNPSQISISQILALLWELIFGRPCLGRTTDMSKGNFTDSCSTSESSYLADQVFADQSHPLKWQFHRFLPYCEGSYLADQVLSDLPSLSIGNFTDSTSDCSYFILPLRVQHLAGHGLAHLPLFQMAISQIPALTAHISFLLWELIIWQTKSWQIYPSLKCLFHRFLLWLLIFLSYSKSSYLADAGLDRSTPIQMAISQIHALLWEFIFDRPSVGKSTPI